MPTNDTNMLRFIHRFLTDEAFRCRVLYREEDAMNDEHLTTAQKLALMSFEPQKILDQLLKDLEAAELALGDRYDDKWNPIPAPPPTPPAAPEAAMRMAANLLYGQGEVQLRGITPTVVQGTVVPGTPPMKVFHNLRLRGQGFGPTDDEIDVEFTLESDPTQKAYGQVIDSTCDPDIMQRVTLEVHFPTAGKWLVKARSGQNGWSLQTSISVYVNP